MERTPSLFINTKVQTKIVKPFKTILILVPKQTGIFLIYPRKQKYFTPSPIFVSLKEKSKFVYVNV